MRFVKYALIGLGALVGLIVVAAIAFFVFFPKDLAVAEMKKRVEQSTGRQLEIGGDIQLTFWPALGFSARQASLSNPQGFGDSKFFSADRIVFAVAVLPLLHGGIEVKQLILEGADLRLVAKRDGANNWTFPTEENSHQQNTLEDLKLDDVQLSHSRIAFQGADASPPMVLENVDASVTMNSLDTPAELGAAFDYKGQRLLVTTTLGSARAVLDEHETPFTTNVRSQLVTANFEGKFNAATGALNGHVTANGNSLRQLLAWNGTQLPPVTGFGAYSLDAQMAHEGDTTSFTRTALHLDSIDARGTMAINAPAEGKLKVSGTLTAPLIDLNPYLPAPAAGAQGVQASTAWPATPIDLSGLRAANADFHFATPTLKFQRMTFSGVQMALKINNGAADAQLTHISLYEGTGTARLIADGSGAAPRVGVELNATGVQAETLLRDAVGFDKIMGHGQVHVALGGQGRTQAAIMHSLHGTTSFEFRDGAYKGVNLAQVARTVQAVLTGSATGAASETDFSNMSASFTVTNGVAATQNLQMLTPYARLTGVGLIDIGNQTMDMRVEPKAVNNAQGQGGQLGIAGLGVPFRISGPWSHIGFAPALGDIVQNELRNRAASILSHGDRNNPLTALGGALFGVGGTDPSATTATTTTAPAPSTSTTTSTTTTTTTTTTTRPSPQDVLNSILGRH